MINKIAFFDFCETLIDFQTADAFVDYVRETTKDSRILKFYKLYSLLKKTQIIKLLDFITRYKYSINKRLVLLQLRGQEENFIRGMASKYYEQKIKPHFILPIIELLKEKQRDEWDIVIVSGGYDVYINLFANEYNISGIMSSQIEFKNGVCTGLIKGLDCMRNNKVVLLNNKYKRTDFFSVAYSDSITYLPFLKWVDEGWVVSKYKSQLWPKKYALKEIIWTKRK